jgi:hypothetical protein
MILEIFKYMEELSKNIPACYICNFALTEEEKEFSKKTDVPLCEDCFKNNWAVL